MKFCFLFISLFISSFAFGSFPLEGCYTYSNLETLQTRHEVLVRTWNEKGKEQLKELKDDSYACVAKSGSLYICKKFIANNTVPMEDLEKRISPYTTTACFGELKSSPTLTTNGESLNIWQHEQEITIDGDSSDRFEFLERLDDTSGKFWFYGQQGNRYEFVLDRNNSESFGYIELLDLQASQGSYSLIVLVNYKNAL